VDFGIQATSVDSDPAAVLTWQLGVSDIDRAADVCRAAGLEFEIERNEPAPGWTHRRILLRTPSGFRLALEGPTEQ
jgi:hypothetical protein